MACCGGGDQALTFLGACNEIRNLWAVDIKAAQLFILAAKADFLRKKKSAPFMPSFAELQKAHSYRIAAAKPDVRSLHYLYHLPSAKKVRVPKDFHEKYAVIFDDGIFINKNSGPFWQHDGAFIERIRSRLNCLQFLNIDIFDCPQYLQPNSIDLLYLSNISAVTMLDLYWDKAMHLLRLLQPKGKIITYNHNDGDGAIYPADILLQRAPELIVEIENKMDYRVLQRTEVDLNHKMAVKFII